MRKVKSQEQAPVDNRDEMLPEYDFSAMQQGKARGRHAKALQYGYETEITASDGTVTRYRTWTNPLYPGSLAAACEAMDPKPDVPMVGLEVECEGKTYTLAPQYNPKGDVPQLGTQVACTALHLLAMGPVWTVTAVAVGSPHGWTMERSTKSSR